MMTPCFIFAVVLFERPCNSLTVLSEASVFFTDYSVNFSSEERREAPWVPPIRSDTCYQESDCYNHV